MVIAAGPVVSWLAELLVAAAGSFWAYWAVKHATNASQASQYQSGQSDSVTQGAYKWAVGVSQRLPPSLQPVKPAVPTSGPGSGVAVSYSYYSPSTGMTYTITLPATPSGILYKTDAYLREQALKQALASLPLDIQQVRAPAPAVTPWGPGTAAAPGETKVTPRVTVEAKSFEELKNFMSGLETPESRAAAAGALETEQWTARAGEIGAELERAQAAARAIAAAQAAVANADADAFIRIVRGYNPSDYSTPEARAAYLNILLSSVTNYPTDRQREMERELANAAVRTGVRNAEETAEREAAEAAVSNVAVGVGVGVPGISDINWALPLTGAGLMVGAQTLAKTLADTNKGVTQGCMQSTGQALGQQLLQGALPAAIPLAFLASPMVQSFMTSLAGKALDVVYGPLERQAPITPEKAPGVGINLLMQAIVLGVSAHMFSVAAESQATLKNLGLGYISAFLVDMAGFQRIAAAYTGAQVQWGLQQPMRYWSLEKFRPMIPSEQNLIRLYGEYAITRPEFNKNMGYQGYPPWWIDRLAELSDRPLSPMLFRYLAEAGELPDELLDRELKNASYNENTIPTLRRVFQRLAAGELKGQFASAVTYAYRYGHLTPADFADNMADLGYSEGQAAKALKASNLDLSVHVSERAKTLYLTQFNAGLVDENDLALRLSGIIAVPELVNIEVALAVLKRKPKAAELLDPKAEALRKQLQAKYVQLYITAFKKLGWTTDQLAMAIESTGVSKELASVTANLEALKQLPTPG